MAGGHSPGVRRRRLSAALRRLREESGLSAAAVAKRLGWSTGKLTRSERNEWRFPKRDEVAALLDLYGVEGEDRAHLLSLTEEARGRSDWHQYADLYTGPLPELEAEAVRIRTYEAVLIPGLLQTPDYAAAVSRASQIVPADQIERKVESRMLRRGVLDAPNGPHLTAVIDEPALRKAVGSHAVMAEQLRFLAGMAAHYKVTVLVLPDEAGAHPAVDGAFTLFDFPRPEPGIVSIPTAVEALYVEDQDYFDRHALIFDAVQNLALDPQGSLDLIGSIAAEHDKRA
ncbi:helix-turn-helix domain-containing protein [Nocardiopsis composta]|uniref:Transcriptional regulator with XRE-family HTH domain n=1 Tax=Nocardiopsis composta TaxID=157465 RepID=A0A7W8QMT2_9ACTN|nr:helix-turn-helix transcriptional regulator [Nocardiopsis composta]MBB5433159.1 transcriptional regulator with XRE-family HTH domain [Nocardiopsis composta]